MAILGVSELLTPWTDRLKFDTQGLVDVLIVRLRSSGFGCYLFGVFGCLMFADAILLLAHTVSAMRHMLKIICDLYAVDYDVKFNSNKLCGRPIICPRPLQVDLWPFNLESGVRVTCDAGYLCANLVFLGLSVPDLGPMYAIVRETDVRCASSFNAPTVGAGHDKSVAMRIDPRYDALCASRLS